MPGEGALIYYRCTNPKHQGPSGSASDNLTIHERRWAFCPHDSRATGHTWTETGGVDLARLRVLLREGRAAKQRS